MQTPTFLQKASLGWRALLPLLALFVGLGTVTSAYAQDQGQSTASIRSVIVTAGTNTSTISTDTYNAIPTSGGGGIGGGIFAGTNFGTLDVNAGRLLLQGGTVQITETAGEVYNRAFIQYAVMAGTLTSTNPAFNGTQTIELTQTSYDASTGVRTFSISNAGRDILALATAGGASNRFDITVNATGTDASNNDIVITGTGSRRRSVFTATGTASTASITANSVIVAPNAGSNVTFYINSANSPQFNGGNLSSSANGGNGYDVNSGQLLLNGGSATTTETGSNVVNSVVLYYRVRSATAVAAYQPITLTQTTNSNGTRTFALTTAQLNLIASSTVLTAGTYNLDVYFQANITNSTTGAISSITDPSNPNAPYSATFTVTGTPIAQTLWVGGKNDNWFDPDNWSNGIPSSTTNALVRDLGAGNAVPYPNIYAGVKVTSTTDPSVVLYDNTGSGPAQARNLIMGGTTQASRSIVRLIVGRLEVYGDFSNVYDSFIQRENTVVSFTGVNQNITGGSFVAIEINGGGTKLDAGTINVSQSITFIDGRLTTDITNPTNSVVVLSDRAATNNNNGAQLINETDKNYLRGFVRTTRAGVAVGETRTYGNIGMTLTFNGANSPGNVEVTRNSAESYNPLNDRYSIRRIFGVRPTDQATNTGGLDATMVFHYQNIDTRVLAAGPAIGTTNIPEENLTLFVSTNSGNTFTSLGRDVLDTLANTLTRNSVRTFATFTLGDFANPLPVHLVAFDAKRTGTNAQLTWATATETNNSGFEVQVSTNGTDFRKLTFVPSNSMTSSTLLTYSYLDTESGKSGSRYYRLRQVDLDGTESYSPVRIVSFTGAANDAVASLTAYPNPFVDGDQLSLVVQATTAGAAHLQVTDVMGREVAKQDFVTVAGIQEIGIPEAARMANGVYVAKITLPTGEVKTLRLQKR